MNETVERALRARAVQARWCKKEGLDPYIRKLKNWMEGAGVLAWVPDVPHLQDIPQPPCALFVKGDLQLLRTQSMAVVGSRRPSPHGLRCSVQFSRDLVRAGYTTVSGLARGIDGASHWATLKEGGKTIAVLGHGLDRIYPTEHSELAQKVLDGGGALVSEYPPGMPPKKAHFPARNRLIAALSQGVLVIEARPKSGSLITARHALDQNREVFVLPGQVGDWRTMGGNQLIQKGAKLVQTLGDILTEFPEEVLVSHKTNLEIASLFEKLGGQGSLQDLFEQSHLGLSEVLDALDQAKSMGEILEPSPQQYIWVGDSA